MDASELSLLQLHQQVQEERDYYLLVDGEKQRQLENGVRDLVELRRMKAAQESVHEQELEAFRQRLQEVKDASELSLLLLHQQVQEQREHYVLVDGEKQRQMEAGIRDLEELQRTKAAQERAHEQELAELTECLASRDTELREATEEAELSLVQLQQAQEELEHYFLKARASNQLAQGQLEQLQRAQGLMVRLHPDVLPTAPYTPALTVEVLPGVAASMPDTTLQTKALLSTYAASLQKASALLERARRS
jgi:hypothetical protein